MMSQNSKLNLQYPSLDNHMKYATAICRSHLRQKRSRIFFTLFYVELNLKICLIITAIFFALTNLHFNFVERWLISKFDVQQNFINIKLYILRTEKTSSKKIKNNVYYCRRRDLL